MLRRLALASVVLLSAAASCIPDDDAPRLGSVAFTFGASRLTTAGFSARTMADGWTLTVTRVLLSYDSVTVSETTDGDASIPGLVISDRKCAYRGRGARRHVVFDPRFGNLQTLNGMEPGECPDVGFVLEAPGVDTEPGLGATGADVAELAADPPAVALFEARASRRGKSVEVKLRFDRARSPSAFTACQVATGVGLSRGVVVRAGERQQLSFQFLAESLFRDDIGGAFLRFDPWERADVSFGDGDGVVTMSDLDAVPLTAVRGGPYTLASGSRRGTFGDFVRQQLGYAFGYLDTGFCSPSASASR